MKLSKLQKFGGVSIILGSVFLTAYSVFFFALLPIGKVRQDMTMGILNPNWIWIGMTAFFGVVLMMFGFTATYSKLYKESGVFGFLGYIFVELAYLFQACKVTWKFACIPLLPKINLPYYYLRRPFFSIAMRMSRSGTLLQ